MNENQAISIKDIALLFWNHIIALLISLVVGASIAYVYSSYIIEPMYSSHISMYVQSYTSVHDGNDDLNSYANDISKSKQLINTYMQVLKDDAVMESVGGKLTEQFDMDVISKSYAVSNGKISPASLAGSIAISSVSDTSAIKIVTTTKNPELSAAVCNELCKQANHFTQKAIGVGEIKSIDTAKVYPSPVSPNKMKNTALGGVAALLIVAAIIFLIDFFDNSIKNTEYLSRTYKKAILGDIEDMSASKSKGKSKKNADEHITLLNDDVTFNVIEGYRAMRTNIEFALSTSDKKAFIVSSGNPGEGKSTTAANIAITMADEGHRVLLIDADMRKPVQHKIFSLGNERGLSSLLSKMKKVTDCMQKTSVLNLSVITSGPIPPNPFELLGSAQTESILTELNEQFDVIVIDSPPVNVVSDTLNLSPYVAGLITVVKCGYTSEDDIKALVEKTGLAHMNLLGFVLTRDKKKSNKNYYKRYERYGKEYIYGEKSDKDYKSNKEKKDKKDKKK